MYYYCILYQRDVLLVSWFKQFFIVWQLFEHLFKVFKHFNILCRTVCVVCVRSPSFPAFQRCLCHPNQLSGCRAIHVFVSVHTVCHYLATVRTLVQSVWTFQYICAGLFTLCVSCSPCLQLSSSASAVKICGLVAELFMFFDYIALWTCKDSISDFKACNHYSCCITTATYTGNTVLSYLVHLPSHSFTMQDVPPSCLSLFGNCLNTCSKCLNISIYLCQQRYKSYLILEYIRKNH